jgi:hypothetical protein
MRVTAHPLRSLACAFAAIVVVLSGSTVTAAASTKDPHAPAHVQSHGHHAKSAAPRGHAKGHAKVAPAVATPAPAVTPAPATPVAAPVTTPLAFTAAFRVVGIALTPTASTVVSNAGAGGRTAGGGAASAPQGAATPPSLGGLITLPQGVLAGLPAVAAGQSADVWIVIAAAEGATILALIAALRRRERRDATRMP